MYYIFQMRKIVFTFNAKCAGQVLCIYAATETYMYICVRMFTHKRNSTLA